MGQEEEEEWIGGGERARERRDNYKRPGTGDALSIAPRKQARAEADYCSDLTLATVLCFRSASAAVTPKLPQ